MTNTYIRTVSIDDTEIDYQLERKPVKNLNLRIRKDGSIFVSANELISQEKVDEFVLSKGTYIISALKHFEELAHFQPQPKQYVSGETFYIQGRGLRLKVSEGTKDLIEADGVYIYLQVKCTDDTLKKQRIVTRFLDGQCKDVFGEVIEQTYPIFYKYGVAAPTLRIRDMDTRWGSCISKKGVITLNKRLLEAPRNCIEYVVMHEFCHFVHPNHSKQFYNFLTMLMPDWRERKNTLDKSVVYWL